MFFRHATDANDAFLCVDEAGRDRRSASRRVKLARFLGGASSPSVPGSSSVAPSRARCRRDAARCRRGTGRDPRASARESPRLRRGTANERFLERFPLARSPRQRGAAATGGVRAPANERARGFPAGRTFGDDVETRVEVASGLCHGGRPWTRSASRDISRAIGSLRIEICASSVTASAYVPTVLNNSAPPVPAPRRHIPPVPQTLETRHGTASLPPQSQPPGAAGAGGPSRWPRLSPAMT